MGSVSQVNDPSGWFLIDVSINTTSMLSRSDGLIVKKRTRYLSPVVGKSKTCSTQNCVGMSRGR